MSNQLYDLITRGVLIQGLIALALVATTIYLAITGQAVPDIVIGLAGTAVGFYFGGESTARMLRSRDDVVRQVTRELRK